MSANRRQFPRVKINVPVTYRQVDDQGTTESELIGVALDISLGGLLVKSFDFVTSEFISISFIDIEDRLAQIECKMAYSRKTDTGMVHTGLSFQGSEKEKSDFVAKMIRAYFYRERAACQVSRPAAKTPPPKGVCPPAKSVRSAALEERRGAP
jgi:c-di-GMP-binding flagellar brake protein YcgR